MMSTQDFQDNIITVEEGRGDLGIAFNGSASKEINRPEEVETASSSTVILDLPIHQYSSNIATDTEQFPEINLDYFPTSSDSDAGCSPEDETTKDTSTSAQTYDQIYQNISNETLVNEVFREPGHQNLDKLTWHTYGTGDTPYVSTKAALLQGDVSYEHSVNGYDLTQPPERSIIFNESQLGSFLAHNGLLKYGAGRPGLRRLVSSRRPPTTPPGVNFEHCLSMPTLPVFCPNTILRLLDQYKEERAADPEAFDRQTKAIKETMVRAKIERGGSAVLLPNELTEELSSRIDAQMVARWESDRDREAPYDEASDEEDEDEDEEEHECENSFHPAHQAMAATVAGVNENIYIREIRDGVTGKTHYMIPVGPRLPNQAKAATGSCQVSRAERIETVVGISKRVLQKTVIEITEEFIYNDEE